MGKMVLVAPHCDDLAFSIGGLLLDGCFEACQPVSVFTVTNFSLRHPPTAIEEITECRKCEDRTFFDRIPGALPPLWLDRLDCTLRLGIEASAIPALAYRPAAREVEEVTRSVREVLAAGDRLVAPLGLGPHPDHRLLHLAAGRLFVAGFDLILYEDLPYAADVPVAAVEAKVRAVGRRLACEMTPRLRASKAIAAARRWALRCYRSQVAPDMLEKLLAHPRRLGGDGVPAERIWLCRRLERE